MEVRRIRFAELSRALEIAWDVFLECDAADYNEEGIKEFRNSLKDPAYLGMLEIYGAFLDEKMVGMLATRAKGTHIALFFVERKYQNQGIGKQLFTAVLLKCQAEEMTLNSAPCAVEVYHKLGCMDTGAEEIENGIRFVPMKIKKNTR